jgi:hypothetical protein
MNVSNQTPDACELLDVLTAVREALGIPYAATVGDDEIRAKILEERLGRTMVMINSIFERIEDGRDSDISWSLAYLRDRLAEHPATGYKTWDERMAELKTARTARA